MSDEINDELDEVMAEVARTTMPTRKRSTGAKPGEGTNQVLIRATPDSHQRWKDAAAKLGVSMTEFVRSAADAAAADLLDCAHPADNRRWYPWAETCMRCGKALRDRSGWLVDPDTFTHVNMPNAFPVNIRKG